MSFVKLLNDYIFLTIQVILYYNWDFACVFFYCFLIITVLMLSKNAFIIKLIKPWGFLIKLSARIFLNKVLAYFSTGNVPLVLSPILMKRDDNLIENI